MNFLTRLKIGQRLGLGFTMVLVLTVVIGLFALSRISRTNSATTDLATNWLVAMRALGEYQFELTRERRAEALYVMSDRRELYEEQVKQIQGIRQAAAQAWKRYADTVTEGDEQKLAENIQQAQQRYEASLAQVLAIPRGQPGFFEAARAKFIEVSGADFDALAASVSADIAFQTRGGDAAYKHSQDAYAEARLMIFTLLFGAIGIGAALAWFITRSITRPIARAVQVAETVAAGDLSSDVRAEGTDETAQLLAALKRMNDGLVTIVSQVLHSSDSIATGSSQIASGNADLSQRTEEQASNLQQTAASMEQLTATVKQNADTARQATQLANHASSAAADGGRVVGEVVSTMHEITESSRRIADIIGVIDGIAFQTNILALNAAVEAARAGEQGRGFAVVASEVRALARRSADAAKEIKTLIGHSVDKVEDGSRLVDEAGKSIGNIVAQVKRVSDLVGEISAASVEQSTGIGQIGDAVSQLDQVTQQNAALVEESAAAADSLKQQAAQLTEVVSAFRLGA